MRLSTICTLAGIAALATLAPTLACSCSGGGDTSSITQAEFLKLAVADRNHVESAVLRTRVTASHAHGVVLTEPLPPGAALDLAEGQSPPAGVSLLPGERPSLSIALPDPPAETQDSAPATVDYALRLDPAPLAERFARGYFRAWPSRLLRGLPNEVTLVGWYETLRATPRGWLVRLPREVDGARVELVRAMPGACVHNDDPHTIAIHAEPRERTSRPWVTVRITPVRDGELVLPDAMVYGVNTPGGLLPAAGGEGAPPIGRESVVELSATVRLAVGGE